MVTPFLAGKWLLESNLKVKQIFERVDDIADVFGLSEDETHFYCLGHLILLYCLDHPNESLFEVTEAFEDDRIGKIINGIVHATAEEIVEEEASGDGVGLIDASIAESSPTETP